MVLPASEQLLEINPSIPLFSLSGLYILDFCAYTNKMRVY